MAEVQQRYSANESAQLEALSDRLLSAFKEATLDLGKILNTKGLDVVSDACPLLHQLLKLSLQVCQQRVLVLSC
jgi:hypothetical protein